MLGRWLGYAAALFCGFLFYLFSPGYLSFLLLVVLVLLPVLSLLLALPCYFSLSLELSPSAHLFSMGGEAEFLLAVRGFLVGRLFQPSVTWTAENLLFPQLTLTGQNMVAGPSLPISFSADHCGWLCFSVTRFTLEDWMGLFRLRRRVPQPIWVFVPPTPVLEGLPAWNVHSPGDPLKPRPGGGPGEEYELRDYFPGDPVQSIHWKLTAKRPDGDPILRETMEPIQADIIVTYDHFGAPQEVVRTLGRLSALASQLLEQAQPFTLRWTDPDTGAVTVYSIACPPDWERCLRALCTHPAPLTPSVPLSPAPTMQRQGHSILLHLDGKEAGA